MGFVEIFVDPTDNFFFASRCLHDFWIYPLYTVHTIL